MKKLVAFLVVLMCTCAWVGADWRDDAVNQEAYVEARMIAKKAFADGEFKKAHKLFLALADGKHCRSFPAVKACQLNSAAYSLIQANEEGGLITSRVAARCLDILSEAKSLSQAICGTAIDSNIAFCEERIKLKDGDK